MTDTPQQRAILRQCRAAQATRRRFPAGTRIRVGGSGWEGEVLRHVPGTNSQGGHLTVRWDDTGRVSQGISPIIVEPIS